MKVPRSLLPPERGSEAGISQFSPSFGEEAGFSPSSPRASCSIKRLCF